MSSASTDTWRIDVHHHVVPPEFADDAMPIRPPGVEEQLRAMDDWHIRAAITSLTPRVLLKNMQRLREVARACNEFQAERMLDHRARFGSFALLPLPDVDGALEEISHALAAFSTGTCSFVAHPLGIRLAVCLRRSTARRSRTFGTLQRF